MKLYLFLLIPIFLLSQKNGLQSINIKIDREDKTNLLKIGDSIILIIKDNNSDVEKIKLPYRDDLFKELGLSNNSIKLYKNSIYNIKILAEEDSICLDIYLKDNIKENNLTQIEKILNSHFNQQSIKYYSKEEAYRMAIKEIGPDKLNLMDENIFPASYEVKVINDTKNRKLIEKSKIELLKVENIDEIKSTNTENQSISIKIET